MTRRPDAPWTPPPPVPAPWAAADVPFDPALNLAMLERSTSRLGRGLGVLGVSAGLIGVASALGLYFAGRGGLELLAALTITAGRVPTLSRGLLALAAVLLLVLFLLAVRVIWWARELIVRLGHRALGAPEQGFTAPDLARTEALRRTLAGWLSAGQWGTVVGALLGVAAVPLSLELLRPLSRQDQALTSLLTDLGPGVVALQTLSSLFTSVPTVIITWLILGAVRRFMTLAVGRVQGTSAAPLTPAGQTVNTWFLFCLILTGLGLLSLLLAGVVLAVLTPLARQQAALGLPDAWVALLRPVLWTGTGAAVLGALLYGLLFALLAWSRSYVRSLARRLDADLDPRRP